MEYYHSITTEKSFQFLQRLKGEYQFILIGGWAVFLYSGALKSKDIDIIVDYAELGKIREAYDVAKNDRLKKYEVKTGEFDVDIYLPHYSDLGVDVEEIQKSAVSKGGFTVPSLEMLFLLKLHAYGERLGSAKGEKDTLDIFSLAALPEFDWKRYQNAVRDLKLAHSHARFLKLLAGTADVPELNINQQQFSKMKKEIIKKLKN